jgi:hypothetical protein
MWILAMIVAAVAVSSSFARLRRVHGALSFDLPALTRALGRTPDAERLGEMREEMKGEVESWETEILSLALGTRDPDERAALVSEVLGDVDAALRWGSRIPAVAARVSALGPLCVVFFYLATETVALVEIVPVIAWAGAGLVGALAVGREADRVAAEARKTIDIWVTRVLDAATR